MCELRKFPDEGEPRRASEKFRTSLPLRELKMFNRPDDVMGEIPVGPRRRPESVDRFTLSDKGGGHNRENCVNALGITLPRSNDPPIIAAVILDCVFIPETENHGESYRHPVLSVGGDLPCRRLREAGHGRRRRRPATVEPGRSRQVSASENRRHRRDLTRRLTAKSAQRTWRSTGRRARSFRLRHQSGDCFVQ